MAAGMAASQAGHLPLRRELAGLPREVWVVSVGSFINRFGGFVVPFLVLYMVHGGYSPAGAALAVSAYATGKIAAGPAGGIVTDRLGPRAATVGSMIASAALTLALGSARGLGLIIATATLTGLASELYRPATSAIVATAVVDPRQRVTAFSLYSLGVSTGTMIGPAVGGLMATRSFEALFVADAATSLLWALVAWRALPEGKARPSGWQGAPSRRPAPSRSARRTILADRRLLRLLVMTILVNVVIFQSQTTLPLQVRGEGLSVTDYGLLLGLNSALTVALQIPLGRAAARCRPELVMAATSVIVGAGFGLVAAVHSMAMLAVTVVVWSLGELIQWPVAAAYTIALAPPGMTGRYAGTRSVCYGVALLLAPLAGTALYHVAPALLWSACAATGLIGAAVMLPPPTSSAR